MQRGLICRRFPKSMGSIRSEMAPSNKKEEVGEKRPREDQPAELASTLCSALACEPASTLTYAVQACLCSCLGENGKQEEIAKGNESQAPEEHAAKKQLTDNPPKEVLEEGRIYFFYRSDDKSVSHACCVTEGGGELICCDDE